MSGGYRKGWKKVTVAISVSCLSHFFEMLYLTWKTDLWFCRSKGKCAILHKAFQTRHGASSQGTAVLALALCLTALVLVCARTAPAWAWFTSSETVPIQTITAGRVSMEVSVTQGEDTISPNDDGVYALDANTQYDVTITRTKDSVAGYALVECSDDTAYYTAPLDSGIEFYIIPEEGATDYRITAVWGNFEDNHGGSESAAFSFGDTAVLLKNGDSIGGGQLIDPTEETTEVTEETTDTTIETETETQETTTEATEATETTEAESRETTTETTQPESTEE